jgi:hypothetical protein
MLKIKDKFPSNKGCVSAFGLTNKNPLKPKLPLPQQWVLPVVIHKGRACRLL